MIPVLLRAILSRFLTLTYQLAHEDQVALSNSMRVCACSWKSPSPIFTSRRQVLSPRSLCSVVLVWRSGRRLSNALPRPAALQAAPHSPLLRNRLKRSEALLELAPFYDAARVRLSRC